MVQRAVETGVATIEYAGFQVPDSMRTYRADLVQMRVQKDFSYCPTIQTAYRALAATTTAVIMTDCALATISGESWKI